MDDIEMTRRDAPRGLWARMTRRKFYRYPFVNRRLQFTFAAILALVGIGNALYLGVLFYLYAREVFALLAPYLPDYLEVGTILDEQTRIFFITTAYIVVPEVILIVLWGLFFSHRLAGPLFSMGRKLREIADGGTPQPVRLRKGDLLPDFADQLNGAIGALSRQRDELTLVLEELRTGKVKSGEERLERLIRPGPGPASSAPGTPPPAN